MPLVRLINPSFKLARSAHRPAGRSSNPSLVLMGLNPNQKRRNMAKHRSYRNHHHLRRHSLRNPFGKATKDFLATAGWAIVGGVATRAIPENFLSNYNTGAIGYVMNAAVALGGGYGLGAVGLGPDAGFGFALGGVVMLAGRIVSEVFGKTVVQFSYPFGAGASAPAAAMAAPTGTSGLGRFGDPAFNLGSYVRPYPFPLPSYNKAVASSGPATSAIAAASKTVHSRMLSRKQAAVM